jgi:hypothetical protein
VDIGATLSCAESIIFSVFDKRYKVLAQSTREIEDVLIVLHPLTLTDSLTFGAMMICHRVGPYLEEPCYLSLQELVERSESYAAVLMTPWEQLRRSLDLCRSKGFLERLDDSYARLVATMATAVGLETPFGAIARILTATGSRLIDQFQLSQNCKILDYQLMRFRNSMREHYAALVEPTLAASFSNHRACSDDLLQVLEEVREEMLQIEVHR